MMTCFEMNDDGTAVEVSIRRSSLVSDKVFCIVDPNTKSIYIWQGKNADVRVRFVGARVASNIRAREGPVYRVRAIEEGEEPESLLNELSST